MRGLIWGFHGALAQDYMLQLQAWSEALARVGYRLSAPAYRLHLAGRGDRDGLLRLTPGLSRPQLEQVLAHKQTAYVDLAGANLEAVPGAGRLLRAAAHGDWRQAALSGASRAELRQAAGMLGLSRWLSALVSGDEGLPDRPAPAGYQLAARRLGLAPRKCWVIESSPAGVQAAQAAGCRCLALTGGADLHELRFADAITDRLSAQTLRRLHQAC